MIDVPEKPLVTFCLLAYKQERFVAEAVRSALAQTYRPLQIVISDDCSPDGTFEVIKATVAEYRGPHQVTLNRNVANLGLTGNLNRAWELCQGQFMIPAAGDDISVPERTEKLVGCWLASGKEVDLVCSPFSKMDESGHPTGVVKREVYTPDLTKSVLQWTCGATGASASYSRRVFEKYGPINTKVIAEDWVLSFRAWLDGGIAMIEEPLVMHRTHGESLSEMARNVDSIAERQARYLQRRKTQVNSLGIAEEWLHCWRIAKGKDHNETERALQRLVELRRVQLAGFGGTRMNAARMACRVLQLGGLSMAVKLFIRHGLRIY